MATGAATEGIVDGHSGNAITFETDRDGNAEVHKMNTNGSDETNVTDKASGDAEPDWQPR